MEENGTIDILLLESTSLASAITGSAVVGYAVGGIPGAIAGSICGLLLAIYQIYKRVLDYRLRQHQIAYLESQQMIQSAQDYSTRLLHELTLVQNRNGDLVRREERATMMRLRLNSAVHLLENIINGSNPSPTDSETLKAVLWELQRARGDDRIQEEPHTKRMGGKLDG